MSVHDSQAYRKMDVTRKPISRILELRETLLSFQTGFDHVTVAVVCAILDSTSGLELSLVITKPAVLCFNEHEHNRFMPKHTVFSMPFELLLEYL